MDEAAARQQVLQRWWDLPKRARRDVHRLSRTGRRHPDQDVAWTAWRWAEVALPPGSPEPGRLRNLVSAAGFWLAIAAGLDGAGAHDPPVPHWLNRRRARRILRAGPPVS
ncbi:hypothetical protein [Dactylosporangium sp. NPDC005555]|uniref:hypothetical protein n=1 Tax=Dactylosporangium sp. NPDC005555 TaxID=3154889 RepID=UPI0033A5345A